jgi:hypothetical protein
VLILFKCILFLSLQNKYVSDPNKTFPGTNLRCLVSVNTIIAGGWHGALTTDYLPDNNRSHIVIKNRYILLTVNVSINWSECPHSKVGNTVRKHRLFVGLLFLSLQNKYVSDPNKTFPGTNLRCLVSVNTIIFELFPFYHGNISDNSHYYLCLQPLADGTEH